MSERGVYNIHEKKEFFGGVHAAAGPRSGTYARSSTCVGGTGSSRGSREDDGGGAPSPPASPSYSACSSRRRRVAQDTDSICTG